MSFRPIHLLRTALESLYGVYVLLTFVVLGLLAFVLVTAVPGLGITSRRAIAHWAARAFFFVAAIRLKIINEHELPSGACVVVANHASYLDGVVLKAALPARFSFVIKKEVSRVPIAGLLLRRIDSEFVDRFNRHARAMDARRLIKAASSGRALAFFPEGTFLPHPGLGKFHTGAFAIAARAGLAVVPLAIRGTRHILPSGRILPKFGAIEIHVLPTLADTGNDDSASVALLRDRARARILTALGEPDLADNDGVAALEAVRKT
jgi:1-acyl-sn-glycerol-3-phosphate acyltransferase